MRDSTLLGLRVTLGGYLVAHGAQKLFGALDGPGLDKAGVGFERLGLKPGKTFAALAGTSEFAGGILTALGAADPVGPVAVAGAMTVAALAHSERGPMMQKGGYELPASYLAAAVALMGSGPGRYSFDGLTGFRLPKWLTGVTVLGALALTGYSSAQVIKTKRAARLSAVPASAPEPVPAVVPETSAAPEASVAGDDAVALETSEASA